MKTNNAPIITIIDDDQDSNHILSAILEEKYSVETFQTWESAFQSFKKKTPNLILLDISMPEIAGTEALKMIQKDKSLQNIPVIALTAHSFPDSQKQYLKMGFKGYIAKPILDFDSLMLQIEKFISLQ